MASTIPSVTGDLDPARLGTVLMHEHVFILTPELLADYPGVMRWDEEARVAQAIEHLTAARAAGIDTIVDLTVLGMGRSVPRVKRIAEATGMQIVVATGLYTYNELPKFLHYVGPDAPLRAPEPMVEMFLKDIREGIGDTGIRAGMLKCATDEPGFTPGVERVVRAVAQTHVETGRTIPITTHSHAPSGNGTQQLDIFEAEGVDLTRVVIGHSGDTEDVDYLRSIADRGATLGMDRFGLEGGKYIDFDARVGIVATMCKLGYAAQMVLSHDVTCWMDWAPRELFAGSPFDMPNWHLGYISNVVVPALLARGVSAHDIDVMLIDTPRRILSRPEEQSA